MLSSYLDLQLEIRMKNSNDEMLFAIQVQPYHSELSDFPSHESAAQHT